MATKLGRGTKRTCQNPECGSRFYDLDRSPIICPICQSPYAIAAGPIAAAPLVLDRKAKKAPEFVPVEPPEVPAEAPEAESTEALDGIETAGEEAVVPAEADETFLEEVEEDSGDMSGILGGTVEKGEKET